LFTATPIWRDKPRNTLSYEDISVSQAHTYSPVQLYNLIKSCAIVFVVQVVIVLLSPIPLVDLWRFLVPTLNLAIAVILGWRLYKYRYHMVFTYDDEGFTLKKGQGEEVKCNWNDFSQVSLFRTEYGELAIRLYANEEFFDLPASKLKLNPFDFRLEVMRLVSAGQGKK